MTWYFLGVDIGGTKTHALVADETGRVLGFGERGPGNHQSVGYAGMRKVLHDATGQALAEAGLSISQMAGAGFGIAGYDWPSQKETMLVTIRSLGLQAPIEIVNDASLGILAGCSQGWGVAVVSGTGCNARGWDRGRYREGRAIGEGDLAGEGAGASELVAMAIKAVSHEWTCRGPETLLTPMLVERYGARNLADLVEGFATNQLQLDPADAPLVFKAAGMGDAVALDLVRWAGCELGKLANGVICQLGFQQLEFDVVLVGSMYDGNPLLIETMQSTIRAIAPGARLVRLTEPPVVGAVLLAMEQAGFDPDQQVRENLSQTIC
jgi:N-acetylglucosamine kinase-like BadF-type ATPase